jgi:hypothetical protein
VRALIEEHDALAGRRQLRRQYRSGRSGPGDAIVSANLLSHAYTSSELGFRG